MSSNKNILLMSPSAYTHAMLMDVNPMPPMGLGYLAAILRQHGYTPKIIDSLGFGWKTKKEVKAGVMKIGLSDEEIAREIDSFKPHVVGISNLFSRQFGNALHLAKLIRLIDPTIVIVIGGPHPSADAEGVMQHPEFDYLIEGEGEIPFLKLVRYLGGEGSEGDLEALYARENGVVRHYPRKEWVDFNDIPSPAYDLMNLELYFGLGQSHGERRRERFMPVITSRGCPAKCTFCSAHKVWARKFRTKDVEKVVAEMKFLKREYHVEELMFEDDNVTLDTRRARGLFSRMIEEKLDFVWDTPNGVAAFALDTETISLMKTAGCYHLNLAIESGNQFHLSNNIKKPLKLERVPALVNHARRIGLGVNTFLVFGMPGETEEMVWDSARFVVSIGIYRPFISIATPYPGTELYRICREKGYLREDFSIADLFIRSFSINTPELPTARLRALLDELRIWLLMQELKHEPVAFISKEFCNTLKNPQRITRAVQKFVANIAWR